MKALSTGQTARYCGISQQTVIRLFDAGQLDGFKVPGSRFRRILPSGLLLFMRANKIPADSLLKDHPELENLSSELSLHGGNR